MDKFLTLTITGLCTAGVFAIAASGLVLTYTTTRIFNFGFGAIAMLGAFTYWQFSYAWGWPPWLSFLVVLLVAGPVLGMFIDVVIMRGLEGAAEATRVVVSVALLSAALGLGLWIWSTQDSHPTEHFWEGNRVTIGGVGVSWHQLFAFACAVVVAVGLRALLYRSHAGITIRAGVDDRPLTMLNGGRPDRSSMLAWAIGCSMAGLAGILIAPEQGGLSHITLTLLIVNAYAAAVFGQLRSLPLTFVGAIALGLADASATGYLPRSEYLGGFRAAVPAILLFVVLIVLPRAPLRGHSLGRAREHQPDPTWKGSLVAALLFLVAVVVVASMVTDDDALTLQKLIGFSIIALSLVPLVGYAGKISLCQMSFAGVGAVVMSHVAGGSPVGLVYAAIAAGLVGALVALPALRLSGIYLALVTGAFAVILDRWIFTLPAFDLGPWEITFFNSQTVPVDRLHIPGVDPTKPRAELVVLGVLFCLLALAVIALRRSQYGERLLALKDSPAACATLGLNVRGATLGVFVFSAAMAGVGGAVYAGSFTSVSPDQFNFFTSLPLLLFAVVGGISSPGSSVFAGTTLYGIPIVAATFPILENLLLVLPGTLGITLGRNPDGVVRDLQNRLDPLRWHRAGQVIVAALLAALCVAEWGGLINGWVFGVGCVLVVFGTARVATYERAAPEPSWEWAGIERPFTSADEETLDVTLGTPELTRR